MNPKIKVGIIGGGISGLYTANKLSKLNDYSVTVYEDSNWGGDIQSITINETCYPISTLFTMPEDIILKDEIERLKISTTNVSGNPLWAITLLTTIAIYSYYNYSASTNMIIAIITIVLLLVYAKEAICYYTLSFGASNNCDNWYKSVSKNLLNILSLKNISLLDNCGYIDLVNDYRNNSNVIFKKEKVTNVSNDLITTSLGFDKYDIIIFACKYDDYKNIVKLSYEESKILSEVSYFDFYSTLVKFKDETNMIPNVLGYQKLKDAYLLASHVVLDDIPNTEFQKSFYWSMPKSMNKKEKQKLNHRGKNVYFIGKDIAGNGVGYCIRYADKIVNLITGQV